MLTNNLRAKVQKSSKRIYWNETKPAKRAKNIEPRNQHGKY